MYVCICHAVTESQVKEAVAKGIDSWKQLTRSLGVATQCGTCALSAKASFEKDLTAARSAKASQSTF